MKPIALVILDGFGYKKNSTAITKQSMPNWHVWLNKYPNTLLKASGEAVGLPKGYMGNSEVGHLTIGAGRVIKSTLSKFNEIIADKSFFHNKDLQEKLTGTVHILGLLSDAGVHSHIDHIIAFIKLARKQSVNNIYVHPFLDGRDTPVKSATKFLDQLEKACKQYNAKIATIHGRYYAMDRDSNWDRTKLSYDTLTQKQKTLPWKEVIKTSYENNITDEFIKPTQIDSSGIIKEGDTVILANFRPERAIQIAKALTKESFDSFKRSTFLKTSFMSPVKLTNGFYLFEYEKIDNTLLDVLHEKNKQVLIVAETEKFAHVTYFFKGMRNEQFKNEKRVIVPSIKTKDYVNNPQMSAHKITDAVLSCDKDFYLINYANADMVGHSANMEATTKACSYLDHELKRLYEYIVENKKGTLFITADHGNAEEPFSHHTTNPVPFIAISQNSNINLNKSSGLKDVVRIIEASLE